MRRILALLGLALLLAPAAVAAPADPDYPDELVALLPGFLAENEALTRPADRDQPWWPEADSYLAKAKDAAEAGRFRVALFHLETHAELVLAHQLIDDHAGASDGEARTAIAQQTHAWADEAEAAWTAYRARLHEYDGKLRSLTTLEKALYATDLALAGATQAADHDELARQFAKQPGVPDGYVLALVRASHTPLLAVERAEAVLEAAVKGEGLPPRVVDAPWANLTAAALAVDAADLPPYLEGIETLVKPGRENGEGLLAVAATLAEQRALRATSMQTMFGDAQSRGKDVVSDAARFMNKQLDNTTLDTPRAYGLEGVFTADAIDRARFTNEFIATGDATLGTVIVAWSALEHQQYATNALGAASPVEPPAATEEKETPAPALLALAALALMALALRRRG